MPTTTPTPHPLFVGGPAAATPHPRRNQTPTQTRQSTNSDSLPESPELDRETFQEIETARCALMCNTGKPAWMITHDTLFSITKFEHIWNLYASAKTQAIHKMNRSMVDFAPDHNGIRSNTCNIAFKPPLGDSGLPQTDEEKAVLIIELTEAILNTEGIHDNPNGLHMSGHWNQGAAFRYEKWQADVTSRHILVCRH